MTQTLNPTPNTNQQAFPTFSFPTSAPGTSGNSSIPNYTSFFDMPNTSLSNSQNGNPTLQKYDPFNLDAVSSAMNTANNSTVSSGTTMGQAQGLASSKSSVSVPVSSGAATGQAQGFASGQSAGIKPVSSYAAAAGQAQGLSSSKSSGTSPASSYAAASGQAQGFTPSSSSSSPSSSTSSSSTSSSSTSSSSTSKSGTSASSTQASMSSASPKSGPNSSSTTTSESTVNEKEIFERMEQNRQAASGVNSAQVSAESTPTTSSVVDSSTENGQNSITYTVKEGDNLSNILKEQTGDGSYDNYMRVAKENGIADPNNIQPGQTITITPRSNEGSSTSTSSGINDANNTASSSTTSSSNGGSDIKQIQFMNADLFTQLKPHEYEDFMYDYTDNASLNDIKAIIQAAGDLKTATTKINTSLNDLASDVYKNRPEVKEKFDSFVANIEEWNGKITERIDAWCEGIKAFYEDQVESNKELIDDLKVINDYLDDGNLSDWNR